jgi:hypothetical protein
LFIDVPEVKIKISHRCLPGVAQGHDILYNRGTKLMTSVSQRPKMLRNGKPENTFS